jgi:bacterioferritin
MKGNEKSLTVLNSRLAVEFTAIYQYKVHSEICGIWGYNKLYRVFSKKALDEMHHAEWLIERILFFEDSPMVSNLNAMKIGTTVLEMITNDNGDELDAVQAYNDAIKLTREVGDHGTVNLLTKILKREEGNVDWAEMQLAQIEQMGMKDYLVNQA